MYIDQDQHFSLTPNKQLSNAKSMFKSLDDVFNLYEICKFTAFSGRKDTLSCKWTRTQNHLIHKRTLNHLTKLAYWPNS